MSESTADRLSRFTPENGLDRDAVLFAAGRASARPARPWKLLAGILAFSQVLTVVLLWPAPPSAELHVTPGPATAVKPAEVPPPDPSSWGYLRERSRSADGDLPTPVPDDSLTPAEPPLRAFAPYSTLLN